MMAQSEPIRSVLYDVQADDGAGFEDFDGWLWTSTFGDAVAEYEAVRTHAGMWDVYPLLRWEFRGPDAARAAQWIFANDTTNLAAGGVRYGPFVAEDGTMLDDGTLYRLAEDRLWAMTNNPQVIEEFDASGFDVEITHQTHEMPLISVQGPKSREILQTLCERDLAELGYFRFWPDLVQVAGLPVHVLRTGFSGELGYELVCDPVDAVTLWTALKDNHVKPFGTHGIEIARIESGMVVYGFDYEPGTSTPYDISFDRLVKIDSDLEFRGKARLAEIAASPPNRLKTLRIDGDTAPEYGAAVTRGGEPVGTCTSPCESPRFGIIGLAVLRSDVAAEGTELEVAVGDGTATATVDVLSVYDPEKARPKS
jgi:aminomethyltransferase